MKVKSIRRKQKYKIRRKTAPVSITSQVLLASLLGIKVDKDKLEASICRDSLYDFVQRFWSEVESADPVWNWHIYVMCHYLQEAAERVFRGIPKKHDVLTNIPPGTTKSLVSSVMFPAWVWARMPSAKIISASHTHELAGDLSRKTREVVQSAKYQRLFPDVLLKPDQNAKHHYETTAGGFRWAAGVRGKFTGRHAHFIIVDDPLDPEEALSEAGLELANRVVSQTLTTRVVKGRWVQILIMQRLHQNDPSAVMLRDSRLDKGTPVKHINLPGTIRDPGVAKRVRPRRLLKKYVDGLLDPVRMPQKILDRQRSPNKLGEYGFAGQYLQHPVPPGGGMFKTDRIHLGEYPPPLKHFKQLVRYWDKAGTEGGGAWTAGVYLGEDKEGRYWILHATRFQHDSWKREKLIKRQAQLDVRDVGIGPIRGARKVIVGVEQEPGSGGKESAQGTMKNLAGFRVRTTRPTGKKWIRADPFSVQVNAGNVHMKPGNWNSEYIEEMKFFPDSTFKDQIDATSGAFEILTRPRTKVGGMW